MAESRMPRLPAGVRRLFRFPFRTFAHIRRDVDDEVRLHLEMRAEELIAAGMSPEEARAEALRRFGDADDLRAYCRSLERPVVVRSHLREWLPDLGQDLHFSGRQLRRAPGFALVAIVTLGLGIGATTTIYCAVHDILLRPLPYRGSDRLVYLDEWTSHGHALTAPTRAVVDAWRSRSRSLEGIVEYTRTQWTLSGAGEPELVSGKALDPAFLPFLGAAPLLGRAFVEDDARPGAPPVALIGETVWRRHFAANRGVLGRQIALDGRPYTVIGVMPRDFGLALFNDIDRPQVFVPLLPAATERVGPLGRLRKGVTAAQAARELSAIPASDPEEGLPDTVGAHVLMVRDDFEMWYRSTLTLLLGAVGLVLLIACANVANLLLIRAWARQREFGIRTAIGAGRGRLVRQLLTESVAIGLSGGALGAFLAWRGIPLVAALRPSFGHFEALSQVRLDAPVLGVTLALAVLTGAGFGLAPALFATERSVGETLKGTERTTAGRPAARRFRSALVIAEIAVSMVLLISACLLVRSLMAHARAFEGVYPDDLLAVEVELPAARYPSPAVRTQVLGEIVQRLRGAPGIEDVSVALHSPWNDPGMYVEGLGVQGREVQAGALTLDFNYVTPEYFRTAEILLIAGRVFSTDTSAGEIVVSRSFARRYLPVGAWLGARVRIGDKAPWTTVVGIVADQRHPGDDVALPRPAYYEPIRLSGVWRTIVARGTNPTALLPFVTRSIMLVDPAIHVLEAETVSMGTAERRSQPRFRMMLLGAFAALALVLAAVGLYAVVGYSVRQRTREIGVRVALGAGAADVVGLVLRQSLGLIVPGIVVGVVAAAAGTRLLRSWLYGVGPGDPATFAGVALLLGLIALLASYFPTRAALRVDPVVALRTDG